MCNVRKGMGTNWGRPWSSCIMKPVRESVQTQAQRRAEKRALALWWFQDVIFWKYIQQCGWKHTKRIKWNHTRMHTFATSHRHTYVYIYFLSMQLIKGRWLEWDADAFYYREFRGWRRKLITKSTHTLGHKRETTQINAPYDGQHKPLGGELLRNPWV